MYRGIIVGIQVCDIAQMYYFIVDSLHIQKLEHFQVIFSMCLEQQQAIYLLIHFNGYIKYA